MNDLDYQEVIAGQIRDLQSRFHVEHEALMNWGAWCKDLKRLYPALAQTHVFDQFIHDGSEGYAEENEAPRVTETEVKAERGEEEDYDEKTAAILDERIHSPGGLPEYLRICIRTAYVDGGPREGRWYTFANCNVPDQFLERLEASFVWVGRFA